MSFNHVKIEIYGHLGIAGPWTCVLDLDNAGLWTKISAQKHTKCAAIYLTLCFWAAISRNLGPESSISGPKVQAQGPAIRYYNAIN